MNRVPSRKQQARSPKQPTRTDKKHAETFHRLPTIRQHPEKETIKKQSQTITQATEHSTSSPSEFYSASFYPIPIYYITVYYAILIYIILYYIISYYIILYYIILHYRILYRLFYFILVYCMACNISCRASR